MSTNPAKETLEGEKKVKKEKEEKEEEEVEEEEEDEEEDEEKEEDSKVSRRSIVYTIAVLVQALWIIFLIWEIVWILTKGMDIDMDHPHWNVIVVVC